MKSLEDCIETRFGSSYACHLCHMPIDERILNKIVQKFPDLEMMDLSRSSIADDDLHILNQLPKLKVLKLWDTAISTAGIERLNGISLVELSLAGSRIDNGAVGWITQFDRLGNLNLSYSLVDENASEVIGRIRSLFTLYLDGIRFRNAHKLTELGNCGELDFVSVRDTGLGIEGIEHVIRHVKPGIIRSGSELTSHQRLILMDAYDVDLID